MKQTFGIVINGKVYKLTEKQIEVCCKISKNQRIYMGLDLINKH